MVNSISNINLSTIEGVKKAIRNSKKPCRVTSKKVSSKLLGEMVRITVKVKDGCVLDTDANWICRLIRDNQCGADYTNVVGKNCDNKTYVIEVIL